LKSGFLEKLITRLDRVQPGEVQGLLARLIREKGFLERVFEALKEGVIILDPDGVITFLNHAAAGFFGLDPEEAVGQRLAAKVRGLDWAGLAQPGKSVSRDMEVFYPDHRFLNFYLAPIADQPVAGPGDGGPLGYVMLVRDLTRSRREAAETLESERFNALTLLAAGVAHEIGNPLNSLDIHLQLLGRRLRKLPARSRTPLVEHLDTARREIARLDTILRQFLQAVRPTAPRRERCDLHVLVHKVLQSLETELRGRDVRVTLDLADDLPALDLDTGQFEQVFFNLLRNAFQAHDGPGGSIIVRTTWNDYEVDATVEDDGVGISHEHMGALFEPFRSTKQSGTGLGLLIVRRIVREHGGEIEIQSEPGVGTRVTLHLPRGHKELRLLGHAGEAPAIEVETA
jgi:signal transduction histidine kinase